MKNIATIALLILSSQNIAAQKSAIGKMVLTNGWEMQSGMVVSAKGNEISQPTFRGSWYKVNVPTTIIAGLLKNKHYSFDPLYGNNLDKIAGPEFDSTWWFRKEFQLPVSENGKNVILMLHGINYRANIWLNGVLVSNDKTVMGPFRMFEFDITNQIKYKGTNVLAMEIKRPVDPNKKDGDLAIDYADWIHYPSDYNGGIVNDVEINTCEKVAIRHPLVTTKFDLPSLATAHLRVYADVINYSDKEQDVTVRGKINEGISFQQKLHMMPGETKNIIFDEAGFPQLNIQNPRIWWPWQYGKPLLNKIELKVIREGVNSSIISERFGIRQVSSELIDNHSRKFLINGKPIMLRGAAWSPDIFQRRTAERQEQEIRLARDMNMNIIRSEGKLEDDHFYELCDKYGMLVMTGWMCCGAWQYPEKWDSAKRNVAMESQRSVMYWLRNKACILVWLNGSDMPPSDTSVERNYLQIENDLKWPNPVISTADSRVSKISGFSGLKMKGPYDWVPPIYWETDSNKYGGSWSFATEISPGPSIPPYESLIKFIPEDSLAVSNTHWLYHCGTSQFSTTNIFNKALDERYGHSSSIKEFVGKAQVQNYEGHRAMMEAYGLNKYNTATGVVQWMLSNPWPGLIWHTYDYYLYPAGTYFGMKKSLEPLHIQYSYKSKEVIINNSLLQPFSNLSAKADLYDASGKLKYTYSIKTSVQKDSIRKCFVIPDMDGLGDIYFLRLQLKDQQAKTVSLNWYWLSNKKDSLDWNKSKWFYTPQSVYADFSALQKLPRTKLKVDYITVKGKMNTAHKITLTNTGKSVAFFVHIRALKGKGADDILPLIFEDNYILLAPGERRNINCSYLNKDAGGGVPYITTSAWNLDIEQSKAGKNAGFTQETLSP